MGDYQGVDQWSGYCDRGHLSTKGRVVSVGCFGTVAEVQNDAGVCSDVGERCVEVERGTRGTGSGVNDQ